MLPPGERTKTTGAGWTGSTNRAVYRNVDFAAPRIAGIGSASVRVYQDGGVRVKVRAQGPTWEIDPARLPLRVTIIPDAPRSEAGQCIRGTPVCTVKVDGTSARCR